MGKFYYIGCETFEIPIQKTSMVSNFQSERTHITRFGLVYIVNFGLGLNKVSKSGYQKVVSIIDSDNRNPLKRTSYSTCCIMQDGKNNDALFVREFYFDGCDIC